MEYLIESNDMLSKDMSKVRKSLLEDSLTEHTQDNLSIYKIKDSVRLIKQEMMSPY